MPVLVLCALRVVGMRLGGANRLANRRFDVGAIGADEEEVFVVAQVGDFADLLAARIEDADLRADVSFEVERDGGDIAR